MAGGQEQIIPSCAAAQVHVSRKHACSQCRGTEKRRSALFQDVRPSVLSRSVGQEALVGHIKKIEKQDFKKKSKFSR